MYGLLGDLPDRRRPVSGQKTTETERDGYMLERWELDLNGIRDRARLRRAAARRAGRRPAWSSITRTAAATRSARPSSSRAAAYLQPVPYAKELTDLGYVALCIDHWVFGERSHATELDTFKQMLWRGRVLWGRMVYDSLRAVDWLVTRPDVDPARIATLGMSMGSAMAQYLAALDKRIKVTVDICCLMDYETLLAEALRRTTASTSTCPAC